MTLTRPTATDVQFDTAAETLSQASLHLNTWTPWPDAGYATSLGESSGSVLLHLSLHYPQVQLVFPLQSGGTYSQTYARGAPLSVQELHTAAECFTGGVPSAAQVHAQLAAIHLRPAPDADTAPADTLELLRTYETQFGLRRTQNSPDRNGQWQHAAGLLATGNAPYFTYGRSVVRVTLNVSTRGPTLHFASVDDSGLNLFFPAASTTAAALVAADVILARCTWTSVPSLDTLRNLFGDLNPNIDLY